MQSQLLNHGTNSVPVSQGVCCWKEHAQTWLLWSQCMAGGRTLLRLPLGPLVWPSGSVRQCSGWSTTLVWSPRGPVMMQNWSKHIFMIFVYQYTLPTPFSKIIIHYLFIVQMKRKKNYWRVDTESTKKPHCVTVRCYTCIGDGGKGSIDWGSQLLRLFGTDIKVCAIHSQADNDCWGCLWLRPHRLWKDFNLVLELWFLGLLWQQLRVRFI